MKNNPLVSVIIPVYNAENFIHEAVCSILNQTYIYLEVIIVNDGSTDNSLNILNELAKIDNRILIIDKSNTGIVDSLNKALSSCSGDYIVRMDADDIAHLDRISQQVSFMEKNSNVDISGSYVKFFGDNIKDKIVKYPITHSMIKDKLLYAAPFCHPTLIIRHSTIKKYSIKYEDGYTHAEDYALYVNYSNLLTYANIPIVLLNYRIATNITYIADKNINERLTVLSKIQSKEIYNSFNYTLNEAEKVIWFRFTRLELGQYYYSKPKDFINLLSKLKRNNITRNQKNILGFLYLRYVVWVLIKHRKLSRLSFNIFWGFKYLFLYFLNNQK